MRLDINDAAMRSASRTAAGIVLLVAAGFGLAWLFMKKHSAVAAESLPSRIAESTPEAASPTLAAPANRHRIKHPLRGTPATVESAEKPVSRH
jgi:hypothetical protein